MQNGCGGERSESREANIQPNIGNSRQFRNISALTVASVDTFLLLFRTGWASNFFFFFFQFGFITHKMEDREYCSRVVVCLRGWKNFCSICTCIDAEDFFFMLTKIISNYTFSFGDKFKKFASLLNKIYRTIHFECQVLDIQVPSSLKIIIKLKTEERFDFKLNQIFIQK